MKTLANQETINLGKIEKNTNQILKKLDTMRSTLFVSSLKFSKKAQVEKAYLFKSLFPKKVFAVDSAIETFNKIIADTNFSKLEKEDQDFISGLEKNGFKDSQYIKEINDFAEKETDAVESFSALLEESLYFNLLNSELSKIESKLNTIRLNP